MKRGSAVIFLFAIVLLLSISLVSASWFSDFWNKLTGKTITGRAIGDACYDSDGGIVYGTQGTVVTQNGAEFIDACFSSNALTEYSCRGDVKWSNSYTCSGSTPYCFNGRCIGADTVPVINCLDSDGGQVYGTQGRIYLPNKQEYIDSCTSYTQLTEYYCLGKLYSLTNYNCLSGKICQNGACVTGTRPTCSQLNGDICTASETCSGGSWLTSASDSDRCCSVSCRTQTCAQLGGFICTISQTCSGTWLIASDSDRCCSVSCTPGVCADSDVNSTYPDGINYYVKGSCYDNIESTPANPLWDYCSGNTLAEQRCSGGGLCGAVSPFYNCSIEGKVCSDGACVSGGACTDGQIQSCTAANTCTGNQTCSGGVWGACTTNLQKCADGSCQINCPGVCADSDVNSTYPDGKNYYQLGNATKDSTVLIDICNNNTNLNESICLSNIPSIFEYNCPNKCENEKCIPFCTPDNTLTCTGKQCGIFQNGTGTTSCGEVKCGTNNGLCPGQRCDATYQCTSCTSNWRAYNTSCSDDIIITYNLDLNSCNVTTDMPANITNYKDCNGNGIIGTFDDIDYNLRGKTLSVDIDGDAADNSINYSRTGTRLIEIYSGTKKIIEFEWNFSKMSKLLNLYNIYIEKQDSSEKKGYLLIKGIEADKTVWVDKKNSTSDSICIEDDSINIISDISSSCSHDDEVEVSCPSSDDDEFTCDIDGNYFEVAYLSHSGVKEIATYSSTTCTPNCAGKECGSNGCGGTCSPGCSTGETCDSTGQCISSTTPPPACTPDWDCKNWSICEDDKQTRSCSDLNDCKSDKTETQSCASGGLSWIYIVIIILVVLIIATIITIYFYTKKNKPQQTPKPKFTTTQQSNTGFVPRYQPRY